MLARTLLVLLFASPVLFAEKPDPGLSRAVESVLAEEKTPTLETVVVTANRSPEKIFDIPSSVAAVAEKTLERRSYRTVPQVLRDIPGIMVQETAPGHGSPYIRGFTSFRTLFLIDGIRLNNSVFRPGPNQYWNTVDPLSIERMEVVKGPASVLYGSDAIGGTVQAFTRSPYGNGGRLFYRVSSAENSHLGRAEASAQPWKNTTILAGLGAKHFGSLVAGEGVGTQPGTGYDEADGDLKLVHFLDPDTRLVLAYQQVRQNNVPRTHKTAAAKSFHGTTTGSDRRREFDQERWLVYAQLHRKNLHANLSWQSQSEVRDRIKSDGRRDKQGFDAGTLGLWLQLESPSALGDLIYGFEYYRDFVSSFSSKNPVQGPVADDATYDLFGLYLQDTARVLDGRVELVAGVRFTYAAADANRVRDPVTGLPTALSENWTALTASLRILVHVVPDHLNLYGGISQGFRAPNLSDLTRFDSARSNEFEIPAPGLDPEHYLTFEIGAKERAARYAFEISVFHTIVRDQIVRFPTGAVNADGEAEITKGNVGDGWVHGIELGGSYEVREHWTLFGNLTYIEGKVDTFPTSAQVKRREYLSRLMPLSAQLGLRWEDPEERFWAEGLAVFADKADRLSSRDRADTQRIPPGGTPGYAVFSLRGGWRIDKKTRLTAAVENLLDTSYRIHGSGSNMPGRNFVLSLTREF